MKSSKILAAAALSILGAVGAQAETYDGVHAPVSAMSRPAIEAEAVRAASAPNQNVTRGSRVAEAMAASKDRAIVETEAIRAAAAPDQNVTSGSRVNSKVISTMQNPADPRSASQTGASKP